MLLKNNNNCAEYLVQFFGLLDQSAIYEPTAPLHQSIAGAKLAKPHAIYHACIAVFCGQCSAIRSHETTTRSTAFQTNGPRLYNHSAPSACYDDGLLFPPKPLQCQSAHSAGVPNDGSSDI